MIHVQKTAHIFAGKLYLVRTPGDPKFSGRDATSMIGSYLEGSYDKPAELKVVSLFADEPPVEMGDVSHEVTQYTAAMSRKLGPFTVEHYEDSGPGEWNVHVSVEDRFLNPLLGIEFPNPKGPYP